MHAPTLPADEGYNATFNMEPTSVAERGNADKPVFWKILVGMVMVLINLQNMIAPSPNLLKAETAAEQTVMHVAYFGMIGLGCWLLYSGLKAPLEQEPNLAHRFLRAVTCPVTPRTGHNL